MYNRYTVVKNQYPKMAHIPEFVDFAVYLYVQRRLKRDDTYKSRYGVLKNWFGDQEFTLQNSLKFLSYLELERKSAPETLNHYRDLLMKIEIYLDLPYDKRFMHKTAPFKKRRKIPKVIHEDKFRAVLDAHPVRSREQAVVDLRMDAALEFIYTLGVRNGEACGLKWEDVQNDRVIIRDTKNGEDRQLPIATQLYEKMMKLPRFPHGYVFGSRQGPMYRETLNNELKARLKMLGWEGLVDRIHELRHSCGTILAEKNINPFKIKEYLGHKDISSTMLYVHMNINALKECSERAPLNEGTMSLDTARTMSDQFRRQFDNTPFTVSIREVEKGRFVIEIIDTRIFSQRPSELRISSVPTEEKSGKI